MKKTLVVEFHPPIEGASKELTFDGETYDADNRDHYSEWAYAVALREFEVGEVITEDDFFEALETAKCQQTLDRLVDMGYVEMYWDSDREEPVYQVTEKGIKYANDQLS